MSLSSNEDDFCAMFPAVPRDVIQHKLSELSKLGSAEDQIVEELMTLSSLISEGILAPESILNSSSSTSSNVDPSKPSETNIKVEFQPEKMNLDALRDSDEAVAVEMVTLEPATFFIDLTSENDDGIEIEEDPPEIRGFNQASLLPPPLPPRKRQPTDSMPETPAKRVKLDEADSKRTSVPKVDKIDDIRKIQEERWKLQKGPPPLPPRNRPAPSPQPQPQYQPQFYNQLSSVRDKLRQKWKQASGGLKRVWSLRDIEEKDREEEKARIDRAGGPIPSANPSSSSSSSSDTVAIGLRALELTNEFRKTQNLPPLKWNQALYNVGLPHCKDMGDGRVPFSHEGFNKRMAAVPFRVRSFAENVAWNAGFSDVVKTAVNGWIQSPGHRKNMVGNFEYCGISVYKNAKGAWYFTQLFASS